MIIYIKLENWKTDATTDGKKTNKKDRLFKKNEEWKTANK